MAAYAKHAKLRGKIKEVFNTQGAFAEAMEMSNVSLMKKLRGETDWKMSEIRKACELLGIPLEQLHIFF